MSACFLRRTLLVWNVIVLVPAASTVAQQSEADPIRCWWRTSRGAIAIGESVEATLTCAVREQEAVRTVPDEARLPAVSIQLSPFEVLGGSHPADLRSATHRFFQYHYTVRVIDRDIIGHDARFPDIQIPYRVHTRTNGEWSAGRDRTYVIPGQSVRVLSLVPADASDIRDSARASFADVAALQFRSRALRIAAIAFTLVAAIIAMPAIGRLARRHRPLEQPETPRARRRAVLDAVAAELDAVAIDARGGWTSDLAARTLHALRLAASYALKRDPAVQPVAGDTPPAGWLATNRGLLHRRQVAVASPVTSLDLRETIDRLPPTISNDHQQMLEGLADAMEALTGALYTARFDPQNEALDDAVASGRAAIRKLRRR